MTLEASPIAAPHADWPGAPLCLLENPSSAAGKLGQMLQRRQFVIARPPPHNTVDPRQLPHAICGACPSPCALVDDGHDRVTARSSHLPSPPLRRAFQRSNYALPAFVQQQGIPAPRRVDVLPGSHLPGLQMSALALDHRTSLLAAPAILSATAQARAPLECARTLHPATPATPATPAIGARSE